MKDSTKKLSVILNERKWRKKFHSEEIAKQKGFDQNELKKANELERNNATLMLATLASFIIQKQFTSKEQD